MFSNDKKKCAYLAVLLTFVGAHLANATSSSIATVNALSLPINVANKSVEDAEKPAVSGKALVSPSKAKSTVASVTAKSAPVTASAKKEVKTVAKVEKKEVKVGVEKAKNNATPEVVSKKVSLPTAAPKVDPVSVPQNDDFSFDLKLNAAKNATNKVVEKDVEKKAENTHAISEADLPKDIQYKANPVEALGNSVLSKLDGDLFSQMSEIEKSTTLLTLELRREKIRNEIEAQKAIRQKNADDRAKKLEEEKLKSLERKKQIEAQVLKEQQILQDKEEMFEVLKQRKLLNAYMNQMLLDQQKWLKEKEDLYAQLDVAEDEKKALIELFKKRIDKVLEASAKNIQVAEAARSNFERIIKNLKAKNEQLRKRVEADALIIKNAKNSLYLKSQSIDELNDKNALKLVKAQAETEALLKANKADEDEVEEEKVPSKLSATYAILGISGRAGNMSVDIIDIDGQPVTLKVGSPLPTGHVVSEIGSDFVRFNRDGSDDYLYVGKTIDGIIPTLGLDIKK